MTAVFLTILNMSIAGALVIAAVLLVRLLLNRAPKWTRLLLWGVVALRLMLPVFIRSELSLIPQRAELTQESFASAGQQSASPAGTAAPAESLIPVQSALPDESTLPVQTGAPVQTALPGETAAPVQTAAPFTDAPAETQLPRPTEAVNQQGGTEDIKSEKGPGLPAVLSAVWAMGVVLMLGYAATSYLRLRMRLATAVRAGEGVFESEYAKTPFLLGFLRPRIYLPFGVPARSRELVLLHEREHLRRFDHIIKPLGYALLAVHWFNPLVWLAYALFSRDIELACDERVIRRLDASARADYSEALLALSLNRRRIAACPLAFGEADTKTRVNSILNYKKPAFWIVIAAVLAAAVLAVCFLTSPKAPGSRVYGPEEAFALAKEKGWVAVDGLGFVSGEEIWNAFLDKTAAAERAEVLIVTVSELAYPEGAEKNESPNEPAAVFTNVKFDGRVYTLRSSAVYPFEFGPAFEYDRLAFLDNGGVRSVTLQKSVPEGSKLLFEHRLPGFEEPPESLVFKAYYVPASIPCAEVEYPYEARRDGSIGWIEDPAGNIGPAALVAIGDDEFLILDSVNDALLHVGPKDSRSSIPLENCPKPTAAAYERGKIAILCRDRIVLLDETGEAVRSIPVPLDEEGYNGGASVFEFRNGLLYWQTWAGKAYTLEKDGLAETEPLRQVSAASNTAIVRESGFVWTAEVGGSPLMTVATCGNRLLALTVEGTPPEAVTYAGLYYAGSGVCASAPIVTADTVCSPVFAMSPTGRIYELACYEDKAFIWELIFGEPDAEDADRLSALPKERIISVLKGYGLTVPPEVEAQGFDLNALVRSVEAADGMPVSERFSAMTAFQYDLDYAIKLYTGRLVRPARLPLSHNGYERCLALLRELGAHFGSDEAGDGDAFRFAQLLDEDIAAANPYKYDDDYENYLGGQKFVLFEDVRSAMLTYAGRAEDGTAPGWHIACWPVDMDGDGEDEYFRFDLDLIANDFVSFFWLESADGHLLSQRFYCGSGHVAFNTFALVESPGLGRCLMRIEPEFENEFYGYELYRLENGGLAKIGGESFYSYDEEGENAFDPAEAARYEREVNALLETGRILVTTDRWGVMENELYSMGSGAALDTGDASAVVCTVGSTGRAIPAVRAEGEKSCILFVDEPLGYRLRVRPYTGE